MREILSEEKLLSKVALIVGDCSKSDLGITQNDRSFIEENINIVYHCAATVRFDDALYSSIMLNVRGPKLMLELAKKCKKLKVSFSID